ncbi:MAG: hypothetical protein KUL76_08565 [Kaistella sp.]|nr:hypothetical protein [Kaistella sp.]
MKKHYLLLPTAIMAALLIIFAFKKTDSASGFIQIYQSSEFTISASRETSTSAWIKFQYPTKRVKSKNGKFITTGGKQNLQLWKVSCHEREYDITNQVTYDRNGKVLNSSSFGINSEPVVPGTVGELIYTHICADNDESYYSYEYDSDSALVDSASIVL